MLFVCLVVRTVENFGAVKEALEWSCSAEIEHFCWRTRRQNCMPIVLSTVLLFRFFCMLHIYFKSRFWLSFFFIFKPSFLIACAANYAGYQLVFFSMLYHTISTGFLVPQYGVSSQW